MNINRIETLIDKYFWIVSIVFILICSAILLYLCAIKTPIWYDESYTITIMKYTFVGITRIASWDVHPPLYYLLSKAFVTITGENTIFAIRIFSFLGIIASFLLALFPIRRLFGKTTSLIFIVLLSLMPVTHYLATEMRMYSWAMFFVLGCSVYAYDAFKRNTFFPYSMMTLFAICGAYTHNYALIATGFIYIVFAISQWQKNKKIRNIIISFITFLLLYSPWIPVILEQVGRVQENFWIGALTPRDILLFSYYFFSPKHPEHSYTVFSMPAMAVGLSVMLILIGIIAFSIIRKHFNKPVDKMLFVGDAFVAIYLLTIITTLIVSLTISPISVPRYTSCVLGPMLLGISVYISILIKEKHKILPALALGMLIIFTIARTLSDTVSIKNQKDIVENMRAFLNQKDSPDYLISTPESYPFLAELSVMFPEKKSVIYSPNKFINCLPFEFGVIKFIPDSLSFFHVESLVVRKSSIQISDNYKIEERLSYPRFNIYLLKPEIRVK